MPETGVSQASSHTSTQQWQSFEFRMRRRRAERCLVRAEAAIEAGLSGEAREALDEARQLEPSLPGIEVIEQRIAGAPPTGPAVERLARRTRMPLVGFGVLALAAAYGFHAWRSVDVVNQPVRPFRPDVVLPAEPVVQSDLISPTVTLVEAEPSAEPPEQPEPADLPMVAPASQATAPALAPAGPAPSPLPAPAPAPTPAPAPPPVNPGVGLSPVPLPAENIPAPPPAPVEDERLRVRAVLSRYEAAYSGLDATAAREVWPGVDERALTRAFEGLASQRLSLGRCDVSVASGSAHVTCSGTASWTPRVGGGSRSENRRWIFDLTKAGDDWQIVRARVW